MKDQQWRAIPILKYVVIEDTLDFWDTLGFITTYRQDRPYKYAVVESSGCQLHFYHNKSIELSTPDNGNLILVDNIQHVYETFCDCLKRRYGKVPSSGLPRISRKRPAQMRFTITDPSGNIVIIISREEKDKEESEEKKRINEFERTIALAVRLRDFKEDYLAAAKLLDNFIRKQLRLTGKTEQAEILIMRAELARALNDQLIENQCSVLLADLGVTADVIIALKSKHSCND